MADEKKVTTVLKDKIYPKVNSSLSKSGGVAKYKRNIQAYFNAKHDEIYNVAPYTRILFGQKETDDFFKSVGLEEKDIENDLHGTYYWEMNFNPKAAKNPLTVTMMMIIRYFIKNKDDLNAELSVIYLAFTGKFYASVHYNSFPKVQPSEYKHVMDYVINEMLSQKFDLKREGTVFGAVRSICRTWLKTYHDQFINPDDHDITLLIQQLHGRLKSFMSNIASLYYEAYDKNLYITYDSDNYSEDNYRIVDSDSLKAERCVENTMLAINGNNIDIRLCRLSSDKNVDVTEIRSIIESIQSERSNLPTIKELLRIMVGEFFKISKEKDVTSIEFVNWAITPKPNSKNPNIIRQEEIVRSWLNENSPNYRKRKNREGTESSYRKSILKYYALMINKCNK